MLKNYLVDTDLRKFFPTITDGIWRTEQDYSIQIDKAFNILLNDLYNSSVEPRYVMVPLDLKLSTTATAKNVPLTSTTETVSTVGSSYEAHNEQRFVVNVSALSGSNSIKLQGTHDTTLTWEDVANSTITIASNDEVGTYSEVFSTQYKYYRYVSTIAGSLTYTASLVETGFDNAIAYMALYLIFRDWMKEEGDIWDLRSRQCKQDYNDLLQQLKYAYDSDADGEIDSGEIHEPGLNVDFLR